MYQTTIPDNYFSELKLAILDTGIRNHTIQLVYKTQIKEQVTNFQDFAIWLEENKDYIEQSIVFHLELAKKKRAKNIIN